MRTIIIGDIHGCIDEFRRLIDVLKPNRDDQIICAGDLVDRGPDSAACVRFARESGFQAVLGNHEEKYIRMRKHEAKKLVKPTYVNPMRPLSPADAAINASLSDTDLAWLEALPYVIEPEPGWLVVHAGFLPNLTVEEQTGNRRLREKIIRIRWVDMAGEFVGMTEDSSNDPPEGAMTWMEAYAGYHNVVYGHAIHSLSKPRIDYRSPATLYGIDTGCCYGGRLTAMVLSQEEDPYFVQVSAARPYAISKIPLSE